MPTARPGVGFVSLLEVLELELELELDLVESSVLRQAMAGREETREWLDGLSVSCVDGEGMRMEKCVCSALPGLGRECRFTHLIRLYVRQGQGMFGDDLDGSCFW